MRELFPGPNARQLFPLFGNILPGVLWQSYASVSGDSHVALVFRVATQSFKSFRHVLRSNRLSKWSTIYLQKSTIYLQFALQLNRRLRGRGAHFWSTI